MRTHIILAAVTLLGTAALGGAFAADTAQQSSMKSCAASWKTVSDADKKKTKYTDYMGTCMKAKPAAAAPAPAMKMAAPAPAMKMSGSSMKMAAPAETGSAKCKDGTVVTYKHRSGTCSGHKGVATWM